MPSMLLQKIQPNFFDSTKRLPINQLDRNEEIFREKIIRNLIYRLEFDFTQNEGFSGHALLSFDLLAVESINIDFFQGQVRELKVNESSIPISFNGFFIPIEKKFLKKEGNLVEIHFRQKYDKHTLYRFVDPKTKKPSLLSKTGSYTIHSLWPCFDQMGLKAKLYMVIKTLPSWNVVGNFPHSDVVNVNNVFYWKYVSSVEMSPPQFALFAGHTMTEESAINVNNHNFSIKITARETLLQNLSKPEFTLALKNGFQFFEKLFHSQYVLDHLHVVFVSDEIDLAEFDDSNSLGLIFFKEKMIDKKSRSLTSFLKKMTQDILEKLPHLWLDQMVGAGDDEARLFFRGMSKALAFEAQRANTFYSSESDIDFFLYKTEHLQRDASLVSESEKKILLASLMTRHLLRIKDKNDNSDKWNSLIRKFAYKPMGITELDDYFGFYFLKASQSLEKVLYKKHAVDFRCRERKIALNGTFEVPESLFEITVLREDDARWPLYKKIFLQPAKEQSLSGDDLLDCQRVALVWPDPYNFSIYQFERSGFFLRQLERGIGGIEDDDLRALAWVELMIHLKPERLRKLVTVNSLSSLPKNLQSQLIEQSKK